MQLADVRACIYGDVCLAGLMELEGGSGSDQGSDHSHPALEELEVSCGGRLTAGGTEALARIVRLVMGLPPPDGVTTIDGGVTSVEQALAWLRRLRLSGAIRGDATVPAPLLAVSRAVSGACASQIRAFAAIVRTQDSGNGYPDHLDVLADADENEDEDANSIPVPRLLALCEGWAAEHLGGAWMRAATGSADLPADSEPERLRDLLRVLAAGMASFLAGRPILPLHPDGSAVPGNSATQEDEVGAVDAGAAASAGLRERIASCWPCARSIPLMFVPWGTGRTRQLLAGIVETMRAYTAGPSRVLYASS